MKKNIYLIEVIHILLKLANLCEKWVISLSNVWFSLLRLLSIYAVLCIEQKSTAGMRVGYYYHGYLSDYFTIITLIG